MIHPIIFEIGALKITWFGVMLATGFFTAYVVWMLIGRKIGRDSNFAADLLLWIMVSGILGARIAYIMANFGYFMERPSEMIMITEGGLVYYGGFIGGGLGMLLFSRLRKMGFMSLVDFVITAVPVSHFFGRIGCFINGCCHGAPAGGKLAVTYPHLSQPWRRHVELGLFHRFERIRSLPVHPVQLYEAVFNLLLFAVLLFVYPRYRTKPRKTVGLYLMVYPVGRMFSEMLRGDERNPAFGAMSVAQVVSLALMIFGIAIFITAARKNESSKESTA
jgi:phosphatidylglycerol:prolipoprotein diacylglycerol transferase